MPLDAAYTLGRTEDKILDLGGTCPPVETPHTQVVLDGVLYGARGAAASTLLRHYEREGIEGIHRLRGSFAGAIWDKRRDRFFLVRDRLGIKPLYYARQGTRLLFANRIESLFRSVSPAFDSDGLRYFCFGVKHPHKTLFQGVKTLPPGHYLQRGQGRVSIRCYWDFKFPIEAQRARRRPDGYYIEALEAKIKEVVGLQLRDVSSPAAILLSGGLDSSALAGIISRNRVLPSYCIAFKGREFRKFDESHHARRVADYLGTSLTELNYRPDAIAENFLEVLRLSEMPTDNADIRTSIPFHLMYRRMAKDGIRVCFSGAGADEVLGGYPHSKLDKIRRACDRHPESPRASGLYGGISPRPDQTRSFVECMTRQITDHYGHNLGFLLWIKGIDVLRREMESFLSPDMVKTIGLKRLLGPVDMGLDRRKYRRFHSFDQGLYMDYKTRMVHFLLQVKHQIPTGAGVQLRMPFLDHELVELAATIPPKVKMRGLDEKWVLKQVIKKVIPIDMFARRERGFTAPFLRTALLSEDSPLAGEFLSQKALKDAGCFDPRYVRGLLRRFQSSSPDSLKAVDGYLLERALAVQGLHHLFVKRGVLSCGFPSRPGNSDCLRRVP